jgi:hypothetical protein
MATINMNQKDISKEQLADDYAKKNYPLHTSFREIARAAWLDGYEHDPRVSREIELAIQVAELKAEVKELSEILDNKINSLKIG